MISANGAMISANGQSPIFGTLSKIENAVTFRQWFGFEYRDYRDVHNVIFMAITVSGLVR